MIPLWKNLRFRYIKEIFQYGFSSFFMEISKGGIYENINHCQWKGQAQQGKNTAFDGCGAQTAGLHLRNAFDQFCPKIGSNKESLDYFHKKQRCLIIRLTIKHLCFHFVLQLSVLFLFCHNATEILS